MAGIDIEIVRLLYSGYAYSDEQYGPVFTGIDEYKVPLIDMFTFLFEQYNAGYVKLDDDLDETLNTLNETLSDAKNSLREKSIQDLFLI